MIGTLKFGRLLAILAVALVSGHARAADVDEATRASVRDVGYQGLRAYKAGRYAEALEKLDRAYSVLKLPTLGLWSARAMAKVGKWVEAAERYLAATRLEPGSGEKEVQKEARKAAKVERSELLPKIPKLTVSVEPKPSEEASVTIDGAEIPLALLGEPRYVNPGKHQVVATDQGERAEQEVTLEPGGSDSVVLHLNIPEAAGTASPGARKGSKSSGAGPKDTGVSSDQGLGGYQRTAAWGVLGLGAAGLAVGVTTGLMASSKKSSLESSDQCVDRVCGPDQYDSVDSYNSLRTMSTVGFIVGGVAAAGGMVLLLTAPESEPTKEAGITPLIGPLSAGLRGRF